MFSNQCEVTGDYFERCVVEDLGRFQIPGNHMCNKDQELRCLFYFNEYCDLQYKV
jgi:hypothetical protein